MRMCICGSYILVAAAVMFAPALSVEAASGKKAGAHATPAPSTQADSAEVTALRAAYTTLSQADHDYQGHRMHAMRALERACDLLGSDIRGNGKGKETQDVSDGQLKDAQAAIQKVRDGLAAGSQAKVVEHLDKAIAEIGVALKIK